MNDITNKSSKISLRGLLRLDDVEDLLESLMDRVNAQEKTIEELKAKSLTYASADKVTEGFSDTQKLLRNLSIKLEQVQAAATSKLGGGKDIAAGELAFLNSIHIQQLSEKLLDYAKRIEVEKHLTDLSKQYEDDFKKLKDETAPIDMANRLELAQHNTSIRITGLESVISSKIDRSEIGHIEALVSKLQTFHDFKYQTLDALDRIKNHDLININDHLNNHDNSLTGLSSSLSKLQEKCETLALNKDLMNTNKQLNDLSNKVDTCALKVQLDEAIRLAKEESMRLDNTYTYCEVLDKRLSSTELDLPTKSTIVDMNKRVLRNHFDEAVETLGTCLDTKSSSVELQAAEDRIKELEQKLEIETARVAIAMRFIEWFTTRGENYEHNLKLIDKHLGNLTTASVPSREPFIGQVRYTNVPKHSNI